MGWGVITNQCKIHSISFIFFAVLLTNMKIWPVKWPQDDQTAGVFRHLCMISWYQSPFLRFMKKKWQKLLLKFWAGLESQLGQLHSKQQSSIIAPFFSPKWKTVYIWKLWFLFVCVLCIRLQYNHLSLIFLRQMPFDANFLQHLHLVICIHYYTTSWREKKLLEFRTKSIS